ncbi:MAG: hypothetical protein JNL77_04925 [Nitrosomonas sp.]|nr:hypothetical protein [Nitrosomonas sp.]
MAFFTEIKKEVIVSQTAAKAIKTRARLYTIRLACQHDPLTLCTGFED